MSKKHIVILYSGGLDSLIMRHYARVNERDAKVTLLYFDLGHDYAYKEIEQLPKDVEILPLQWLVDTPKGKDGSAAGSIYIPGRNLVLATLAACKYLPDEIWIGALRGEIHEKATDKNYAFLDSLNQLLGYTLEPFGKVEVKFPLADAGMGKLEATQWALNNDITKEQISNSSSCLSGEKGNCGRCIVCVRRWGIFGQLGIKEKYNVDVLVHKDNRELFLKIADPSDTYYDEFRKREIVPLLERLFNAEGELLYKRLKNLYEEYDASL